MTWYGVGAGGGAGVWNGAGAGSNRIVLAYILSIIILINCIWKTANVLNKF